MRVFYDPATLGIAVAGLSFVSSIQQGQAAAAESEAQARDAEAQAEDIRIQSQRDIRDEQVENRRQLARQRAALAAQGVDATDAPGLLVETRRESLLRQGRTRADARRSIGNIGTTAGRLRSRARSERAAGFVGGVARAGQSLLAGGVV